MTNVDSRNPQDAGAEPPPTAGLPVLPSLVAWIEMFVLLVVPVLCDRWIPSFPPLQDMQPHFFWLPVLLLSLQYGTVSGLVAAGIAILLSGFLGWPDQEIGENHFSYLLRVSSQPMLWLMAALILGQFRTRQIERKLELARQVDELTSQREALAEYCTGLRTRCEQLERRLANGDESGDRRLAAALGRLGGAALNVDEGRDGQSDGGATTAALDRVLEIAFGACQASLFVKDRAELKLLHAHGWPDTARWRKAIETSHSLFEAVAVEGRSISVMRTGDETVLAGEGLVAVPVFSRGSDRVVGMLKLEKADPAALDRDTTAVLDLLASRLPDLVERRDGIWSAAPVESGAVGATLRPRLWRQMKWKRGERDGSLRKNVRTG